MASKSVFAPLLIVGLLGVAGVSAMPILPNEGGQRAAVAPFDAALAKAYEALGEKRPADAKRLFEEAAKLDPKSIFPWLGLADVARLGNDAKAIESALKKAMELGPERPEPVIAMARYHYMRKAYDEAEALLRKAAKIAPKSEVPLIDLGDLYAGVRQDTNKAMEFYRQAIQVAPNHAGAHYALGMLLLGRHDALGAIPLLEKSQDLAAGKTPLPSMGLGRAYSQARKWKDAQEAFTRALTIQPGLADAYIGRAGTFLAAGNRAKALADLQKAEESNPNGAEAPLRIGLLQQEDGAAKEAYAAYERALRLEPKLVLAYNNLAWLAATRRERLDEALAWIQKARSLAPKEAMLYDTHGWVLRARGDPAGAMTVLNEGIGLQPSADLHYHLGVVQMEAGRADDARGNFRKALQIQPDFGDAKDAKSRLRQLEAPQGNK